MLHSHYPPQQYLALAKNKLYEVWYISHDIPHPDLKICRLKVQHLIESHKKKYFWDIEYQHLCIMHYVVGVIDFCNTVELGYLTIVGVQISGHREISDREIELFLLKI